MWRPYFQTWIFLVQYSFKLHQSEKNMTVAIWVCLCVHKQDANNHKTIPKDQSFGRKKEAMELHLKQGKHTINKWSLWGAKVSSSLTLLCLVVLFEAESFIIVVHLKPDWPPQAPVDVQQPLEDEHSVFLHTRAATHAETDNNHQRSGSQGGISCWPPATVALCQVYVQAQALAAFTGAKPFMTVKLPLGGSRPFILWVQGWSHVWQGKQRRSGIFSLGHVQEGGKILILSRSDSSYAWLTCSMSDVKIKIK